MSFLESKLEKEKRLSGEQHWAVFGPRPLGSGSGSGSGLAQRPFWLGRPSRGAAWAHPWAVIAHRASTVARPAWLTSGTMGGEVGGEASPRWGLCAEQVHGGEGSPKHRVNVEAGRSGGTKGFQGDDGSPTNGVGFLMVLQWSGPM
jgi:hypothetical protein